MFCEWQAGTLDRFVLFDVTFYLPPSWEDAIIFKSLHLSLPTRMYDLLYISQ